MIEVTPAVATTSIAFDVVGGEIEEFTYQLPPQLNPVTRQIEIPPLMTREQAPVTGGALRFSVTSAPAQDGTEFKTFSFDVTTTVELVADGVTTERLEQLARAEGLDLALPVACARVVLTEGGEVTVPPNSVRYLSDGGRVIGAVVVSSLITGARVGRGNSAIPAAPIDGNYVVGIRRV